MDCIEHNIMDWPDQLMRRSIYTMEDRGRLRTRLGLGSTSDADVCLEMSGCLMQAERTIAIRKRKFVNKFSVIHNALCSVFVAIAQTELESCCTDV